MVWKPRVTVGIICERNKRFLMVEECIHGETRFNQPAGHLEDQESLIDAAMRECMEETACQFDPQALVGLYRWRNNDQGETFLRATFCGDCGKRKTGQALDADIVATHWLSTEAIRTLDGRRQLRSPLILRSIDDYLAGRRYSLDLLIDVS